MLSNFGLARKFKKVAGVFIAIRPRACAHGTLNSMAAGPGRPESNRGERSGEADLAIRVPAFTRCTGFSGDFRCHPHHPPPRLRTRLPIDPLNPGLLGLLAGAAGGDDTVSDIGLAGCFVRVLARRMNMQAGWSGHRLQRGDALILCGDPLVRQCQSGRR
jgi:hypothetical protein